MRMKLDYRLISNIWNFFESNKNKGEQHKQVKFKETIRTTAIQLNLVFHLQVMHALNTIKINQSTGLFFITSTFFCGDKKKETAHLFVFKMMSLFAE